MFKKKAKNRIFCIFLGLSAESATYSSVSVSWDPVQTVRGGESIEYLLQGQCVGKDQDFLRVGLKFLFNAEICHLGFSYQFGFLIPQLIIVSSYRAKTNNSNNVDSFRG